MSFHRSNLRDLPPQNPRPTQGQRAVATLKQRCSFGKKQYSNLTEYTTEPRPPMASYSASETFVNSSPSLSRPLYSRANTTSRARPVSTGYLLGDESDEDIEDTKFSRRRMKPETKPAFANLKLCVLRAIGLKNNSLS